MKKLRTAKPRNGLSFTNCSCLTENEIISFFSLLFISFSNVNKHFFSISHTTKWETKTTMMMMMTTTRARIKCKKRIWEMIMWRGYFFSLTFFCNLLIVLHHTTTIHHLMHLCVSVQTIYAINHVLITLYWTLT